MQKFLVALALTGLVDAVSYMVVAPSIVFYVLQVGGTYEQYGVILSAFSFASFCTKPFLGAWCDRIGFRAPYLFSLTISAIGGFLYLIASCWEGNPGVRLILAGRLLGGVGAANAALGYAYLSKMVPHDQQTKTNSLLSMTRIGGMAAGPGVNVFLANIDTTVGNFHLDSLNSVGVVLICSNIVAMCVIFFLLEEPPSTEKDELKEETEEAKLSRQDKYSFTKAFFTAGILVPLLSIFAFNANFQMIETGFAPAANHALGWGPIQTSAVLGSVSVIICINMLIVFQLSARKVRDEYLVCFGATLSAVAYTCMYFSWKVGVPAWLFCLPIVLGTSSFPFMGAPTRSIFTKYVDLSSCLGGHQGTMQAILSMGASVAGFVTPGFVATFILRSPDEVEASSDQRELTQWALLAPSFSVTVLIGFFYLLMTEEKVIGEAVDKFDEEALERTSLLFSRKKGEGAEYRTFSPRIETYRRQSACLMGMAQSSFGHEHAIPNQRKSSAF